MDNLTADAVWRWQTPKLFKLGVFTSKSSKTAETGPELGKKKLFSKIEIYKVWHLPPCQGLYAAPRIE